MKAWPNTSGIFGNTNAKARKGESKGWPKGGTSGNDICTPNELGGVKDTVLQSRRRERTRLMMLYTSISSPSSRYFFEEPSFSVAVVLLSVVARWAPKLTVTPSSLFVQLPTLCDHIGTSFAPPRPEGKPITSHRALQLRLPKKCKSLHFSPPLRAGHPWRRVGEPRGRKLLRKLLRFAGSGSAGPRWLPLRTAMGADFASNWPVRCLKGEECR